MTEITRDYLTGLSLEEVAGKHGVSPGTVRNVLRREGVPRRPCGPQAKPLSETKICSRCEADLPRSDFYGNGAKTSVCIGCTSTISSDDYRSSPEIRSRKQEAAASWQRSNPEKARQYKRQWASGWTQEQFEEAWASQEGRCAICQLPMVMKGRGPSSVCADHDHATGRPRSLLCRGCNLHLGIYEKHRQQFEVYLLKHGARS